MHVFLGVKIWLWISKKNFVNFYQNSPADLNSGSMVHKTDACLRPVSYNDNQPTGSIKTISQNI